MKTAPTPTVREVIRDGAGVEKCIAGPYGNAATT
jgi:hypothetical protein